MGIMGKIITFFLGFCIAFFLVKPKEKIVTKDLYIYNGNKMFLEKKTNDESLPIFVQPKDSDKIKFMTEPNVKNFYSLMDRYFYVPIEEEGLLYALTASNTFEIQEAESYIYRYLSNDYLGAFLKNIGKKHLIRGVRNNDSNSIILYKGINYDKKK